ncbi:MAG TPA: hypothetical protein PKC18_19835, partial [Lacipirellulaceae bacterium]|nr:hypothetical protein [Lacipirellulaceae bacterium]
GTTPPGGWGSFPPQSSAAPGDAISIPADQGSLHYAAAEFPTAPPVAAPLAAAPPADALLPIQSLLPMSSGPTPQQLAQREVQPAEYLYSAPESGATLASAQAPRDGFRPQGSQPLRDDAPTSPSRAPLPGRDAAASTFAADAQYQWLRGQLEYSPASAHWSLPHPGAGAP